MSVFGTNKTDFGGIFSADDASFKINEKNVGLIQNFQIQCQLQFQPVYEFGSKQIWFSRSPAAGTITIQRMIGGTEILDAFTKTDDQKCNGTTVIIEVGNKNCKNDSHRVITLYNLFLTGVQWSGQAGQAFVMEGVTGTFVDVDAK